VTGTATSASNATNVLNGIVQNVSSVGIGTTTINDANTKLYVVGDAHITGILTASINFLQSGTGAVARTVDSKLKDTVSVKDFGAVGDGVANDTAAFNSAIATGKKVFIPDGTYSVADISVINGIHIEGNNADSTVLVLRTNSASIFLCTSLERGYFANFSVKAETVTGGFVFKQTDRSNYTAYVVFENIEVWKSFLTAFYGFFIYTEWRNIRSGYLGNYSGGQTHKFIDSNPAAYGQGNQTNFNQVVRCQLFGANHANGAIDISYGANWLIDATDFEQCPTRALTVKGVQLVNITNSWIEICSDPTPINIDASPAPNPQSVDLSIDNLFFAADSTNTCLVGGNTNWTTFTSFANIRCTTIPSGAKITNPVNGLVRRLENVSVASGDADFLSTVRQATNSNLSGVKGVNLLGVGPGSIGQANLTKVGTVSATDITSAVALGKNDVQITLGNSWNLVYIELPQKLSDFLRGKAISFAFSGYGDATGVGDFVVAAIWDSVTPSNANVTAGGPNQFVFNTANLQTTGVTYSWVNTALTGTIKVGLYVGGSNLNKTLKISTMECTLSSTVPQLVGF